MDALETFGDDSFHAEQEYAFRGPISTAAHAVVFSSKNEQRHVFLLIRK